MEGRHTERSQVTHHATKNRRRGNELGSLVEGRRELLVFYFTTGIVTR